MRPGVLDVGFDTVHLLAVNAHRGGHLWPAFPRKSVLRPVERIPPRGDLTADGADALSRRSPRPGTTPRLTRSP